MNDGGARSYFAGVLRLVPYSGVQLCDIEIARAAADAIEGHFTEEIFDAGGMPQRILLQLDGRKLATAAAVSPPSAVDDPTIATSLDRLYHPLSGKPVDPSVILTLDGAATIAHFAGQWVPLPYLRFVGRGERQRLQFDAGPSNWVRAFVAQPGANPHAPIRVTLAFDTSLDVMSRMDSADYLAPNVDDAAFGSTFICAETVDDVTPLLAEPWLETWLAGVKPAAGATVSNAGGAASEFQLTHIAQYLTLLKILGAAGALPEARFTDTIQKRYPLRTTPVDLVLDIGETETTAMLVDISADQPSDRAEGGFAEIVRVRDLSQPDLIHEGPFPTVAEFSAVPFGDAVVSRDSGRTNAFHWPSLVRIGEEAQRLSLRHNGTDGVTGLSNLRAFLLDDAASPGLWRQSTDDCARAAHAPVSGPMVSGELLGLIAENGTVLGARPIDPTQKLLGDLRPAIRPRFSRSSMLSFFAAELALHAIAQVNSAARDGRAALENDVRELRQVVVLAPPSLSAEEQQMLLGRVDAGLELVWRGLGWDAAAIAGVPKRPEVVLGVGGDLGAQVAFLHNEVATKYQGRFADLLRVYRGGETTGVAAETLRVASIDFGAQGSNLMIADYAAVEGAAAAGEWHPSIQVSERLPVGTDTALQALIWALVLPAIEAHLNQAGLSPARQFLDEITGRATTSLLVDDPYFTRRLNRKVLWPAARGLFALNEHGAASIGYGNRAVTLMALVQLGGGRLDGVASAFDAAALQAGARGFSLGLVKLDLARGEIGRIIRSEMRDCVQQISRVIASHTCDLLLIGGEGTRLPALCDEVLAVLPVPASRIIDLNTHVNQTASDAMGQTSQAAAQPTAAALLPAIAAALDRRQLLDGSGLASQTLRQLALPALDAPPEPHPGQRAIGGPSARDDARAIPAQGG